MFMRFFRIVYVLSIVGDSCCVPGSAREPELEPKHKIFLNHSGVQKTFTEQLCKHWNDVITIHSSTNVQIVYQRARSFQTLSFKLLDNARIDSV